MARLFVHMHVSFDVVEPPHVFGCEDFIRGADGDDAALSQQDQLAADRRRIVRAVGVAALAVSLGWSLALCAGGIEARLRDPRPDAAR